MKPSTELGELVKEFLSLHPNIPTRRVTRFIVDKNPHLDYEKVRGIVRYHRGQMGVGSRVNNPEGKFFDQKYDLPAPSEYDSSEFKIPESTVLVLSDLQIPFHDLRAIETAVDWAKNYSKKHHKIEAILLNGDVLDIYQLSSFSRDPRERRIKDEIDDARDFLDMLKEEFNVPIYWKFGNHEERFERYLYQQAPELGDIQDFTLENVLKLGGYNCKVIKDKRVVKIGHLNVIHGHEFKGGMIQSVNPARTFFLRAKAATLGGDRHQTSEHSGRAIDGKLTTCWSTGCLCGLKPKYMPMNEWNHGFAVVRNDGNTFRVLNLRIENGVVY